MKAPRPLVAYDIATGNARRFATMGEAFKTLDMSETYATKRINSGITCKGFLLYDMQHGYTPETIAHVRKLSPAFDEAFASQERNPDHEISVRIDSRTVIMVKASKWTPDYAERYRRRMEASKPKSHTTNPIKAANDHMYDHKRTAKNRRAGRPRKEAAT